MVSVRINGEEASLKTDTLHSMADVVELVKTTIDPEHMITNLFLNGKELMPNDWQANANQAGTMVLEVETGTPDAFIRERFGMAWQIVGTMYIEFRDARKNFQGGNMVAGNKKLINAVRTAKAFFDWYGAMLAIVPAERKSEYDITEQVGMMADICKRLCQQQLYQSWWAIGETIEKELEPTLDKLEDRCREFAVTQ